MADRDDVCVLMPTYNEAETIGDVVSSFTERGFDNVLVIDGGSDDGTRDIAADVGARVVEQSGHGEGQGKGQAVREGIRMADAPIILMLDGDATYKAQDAAAMLEPIFEGRADHVIGDRFADMESGAMTRLNRIGNRLINTAFSLIHRRNLQDILSGYRAFTKESVERFNLTAHGFGIETQMSVECVKHGVRTEIVPIRYEARPDESETNLHPIRDGATIIFTLYQMAKTNNPLFYFGSVGTAATVVGVVLGAYVAVEWVTTRTSHEVIAVLGVFAILFGVQLLIFGVLSDMIVTLNREQTRRIERLTRSDGVQSDRRFGLEQSTGAEFDHSERSASDSGEDDGIGDGTPQVGREQ
jgi:glycosyltransferase (TIGR04182 family)